MRQNRAFWERGSAAYQYAHAEQLSVVRAGWGVWQLPEADIRVLGDVRGLDVLEFGCGAAQWSIYLAGARARPVGLDLSARQLAHARQLMQIADVAFPLIQASAEDVPLRDAAFDIVFCDHGAMSFADPYRTVPEAARLLRPGGLFTFSNTSPVAEMCWPPDAEAPTEHLVVDYFGLYRLDDGNSVTFQLPYGSWIRLFRQHGLVVEDLIELQPPADAVTTYGWPLDWCRRWPGENIWKLRREA